MPNSWPIENRLPRVALGGAYSSLVCAATGAVGAQVLKRGCGWNYDVFNVAQNAACGGLGVGIMQMLQLPLRNDKDLAVHALVSLTMSPVSHAVGVLFFRNQEPLLEAGKGVLASTVGTAVVLAGAAFVGASCLGILMMCLDSEAYAEAESQV